MPTVTARVAPAVLAALVALWSAPPAAASPECLDPGPTTRICQKPGHTQITTTPSATLSDPFPIMYGGFGTGLLGVWSGR